MNKLLYQTEVTSFPDDLSWLEGKTILFSGATGMIASYMIDVILAKCKSCKVIGLGRNLNKAMERLSSALADSRFQFQCIDINDRVEVCFDADYVIHTASATHPMAYSTDPIGTISANVIGLKNLLDYAVAHKCERFVFLSSVEVYGENRGDVASFDENYCGYINCNTLRAGYPESKRVGEALCQAYIKQMGLDIVIPRLARVFGPTLQGDDTKALSQFLHKALGGEDIVLKSAGTQFFSYLYVADAASGIFACLKHGKAGEAYNLADEGCNISLKDLASLIASLSGTSVKFELPDATEKAGYSTATRAVMDNRKIRSLGWRTQYGLEEGVRRTLEMLR